MANREQRRSGKKLLNKPELKKYVDQFCMEFSSVLVESYEKAKEDAEQDKKKVDFSKLQEQLEPLMKQKGEELGRKVQEIAGTNNNIKKRPRITYSTHND